MALTVLPPTSTRPAAAHATLGGLPLPALVTDAADVVVDASATARALLRADPCGERLESVLPCGGGDAALRRSEILDSDDVPRMLDVHVGPPVDGLRTVLLVPVPEAERLAESLHTLDAAFESAPIGMAFFNPAGQYVRVNPALCRLLGRTPDELLGRRDQELTHPDDREADLVAARAILAGEIDSCQAEKRFVRPGGEVVWAIANMTFLRDGAGRALHWLGQFQDISATKDLQQRLLREVDEDPLTGLPNRRRFERELEATLELSRRHGSPGAALMLDVDGFKAINDARGHAVGDAVLVAVTQALLRRVRRTDTLARIGGDEFALLLPRVVAQGARAVAASVERAVAEATLPPGIDPLALSVSVGIATFGGTTPSTAAELLARADASMQDAKRGVPR